MKLRELAVSRRLPALLGLALPVLAAVWLGRDEWLFRQALARLPERPAPAVVASQQAAPLNHAALLTVMGLQAQAALAQSGEALQLRGSLVASQGTSLAWLAGSDGQRSYRVGETLPGGSILQRIEVGRVVLWRNGRAELLALPAPAKPVLRAVSIDSGAEPVRPAAAVYFRSAPGGPVTSE